MKEFKSKKLENLKGAAKLAYAQALKFAAMLSNEDRANLRRDLYYISSTENHNKRHTEILKMETLPRNPESVINNSEVDIGVSPKLFSGSITAVPVVYVGPTLVNNRTHTVLKYGEYGYLRRIYETRWARRRSHIIDTNEFVTVAWVNGKLGISNRIDTHKVYPRHEEYNKREETYGNFRILWNTPNFETPEARKAVADMLEAFPNPGAVNRPKMTRTRRTYDSSLPLRFAVGEKVKAIKPRKGVRGRRSYYDRYNAWEEGKIISAKPSYFEVYFTDGGAYKYPATTKSIKKIS